MKLFILLILVGFSVWAWFFINDFRRKQKRRMLLSTPFPPAWDDILKKNLPPYGKLSPQLRQQLHDATRIVIAENPLKAAEVLLLTMK